MAARLWVDCFLHVLRRKIYFLFHIFHIFFSVGGASRVNTAVQAVEVLVLRHGEVRTCVLSPPQLSTVVYHVFHGHDERGMLVVSRTLS